MTLISHYDQVIDLSRIVHVRPVRWPSVDLEHGLYISFGADDSYRLEYSNKTNRDLDYTILTAAILLKDCRHLGITPPTTALDAVAAALGNLEACADPESAYKYYENRGHTPIPRSERAPSTKTIHEEHSNIL